MDDGHTSLQKSIVSGSSSSFMSLRGRYYEFTLHDMNEKRGSGKRSTYWGMKRPHLNIFLSFCFSYFKVVAVWSAGQPAYVEAVVENIFEGIGTPAIVYTFNNVIQTSNGYHKPLSKMIEKDGASLGMSLSNTFFLDDRYDNFPTCQDNAIVIPRYSPSPRVESLFNDDIALLQFRQWLLKSEVVNARDVRKLDKSSIFFTPVDWKEVTSKMMHFNTDPIIPTTSYTSHPSGNNKHSVIEIAV